MSCFFDGLLAELTDEELKVLEIKRSSPELIKILKLVNKPTPNVLWQGKFLKNKTMLDNLEHVKSYDAKTYKDGYLTSSADPFMLLLCELFCWNITFKYNGSIINMRHRSPLRKCYFRASRTHFERGR